MAVLNKAIDVVIRAKLIRGAVIAADLLATLILSAAFMLASSKAFAFRKNVVLLTEGGFGHAVIAPDIARR